MHANAAPLPCAAATAANHSASPLLHADEEDDPRPFRKRIQLQSSAWLSHHGRGKPLRPLLLVERLVVIAGLTAAFIILKCAFELSGDRSLAGLQRSLAASGGYRFTGICGGIERDCELLRSRIGVCESEPEEVTYERILKVFDLLQELQKICTVLTEGRGLLLQARIASFYLIVSAQELAAVSGMLPHPLEVRRVQLTNSGSNMASLILERFPACAAGDNAFRRISRLLLLNNQLLYLPETCTLGRVQCRIRLQHLGLVQLVFLDTSLALLNGLIDFSGQDKRPSNHAVSEMLTAMTELRHKRRVQILGDHGLGPWVAQYLLLGCPNYLVKRERERQRLLDNNMTPVEVLVKQLEAVAARIMDTTERGSNSAAVARTPGDPARANSAQRTLPRITFRTYPHVTAALSPTENYAPRIPHSALQDGDSSQKAVGWNLTRAPCLPIFLQLPLTHGIRTPAYDPSGQQLLGRSLHRSGQPSADVPASRYSSHQITSNFQAGQAGLTPLCGTPLRASSPTVHFAAVERAEEAGSHRKMCDPRATERTEDASGGSVFYGVAQGEPRPSGTIKPLHGEQMQPVEHRSMLNIGHPFLSETLREHVYSVSTANVLHADKAFAGERPASVANVLSWSFGATSRGAATGVGDKGRLIALHRGVRRAEQIPREGCMQAAGAESALYQESPLSEYTDPRWPQD